MKKAFLSIFLITALLCVFCSCHKDNPENGNVPDTSGSSASGSASNSHRESEKLTVKPTSSVPISIDEATRNIIAEKLAVFDGFIKVEDTSVGISKYYNTVNEQEFNQLVEKMKSVGFTVNESTTVNGEEYLFAYTAEDSNGFCGSITVTEQQTVVSVSHISSLSNGDMN